MCMFRCCSQSVHFWRTLTPMTLWCLKSHTCTRQIGPSTSRLLGAGPRSTRWVSLRCPPDGLDLHLCTNYIVLGHVLGSDPGKKSLKLSSNGGLNCSYGMCIQEWLDFVNWSFLFFSFLIWNWIWFIDLVWSIYSLVITITYLCEPISSLFFCDLYLFIQMSFVSNFTCAILGRACTHLLLSSQNDFY